MTRCPSSFPFSPFESERKFVVVPPYPTPSSGEANLSRNRRERIGRIFRISAGSNLGPAPSRRSSPFAQTEKQRLFLLKRPALRTEPALTWSNPANAVSVQFSVKSVQVPRKSVVVPPHPSPFRKSESLEKPKGADSTDPSDKCRIKPRACAFAPNQPVRAT
ncbi:MAG: hypothetical protein JWL61_4451 [Gemmatimonadetes bacterium]|nr:hypothetical protein [Gemmatimonadota bacterium]